MDMIAAEAGVSKQTVYNHFQSKEGLFKAAIGELTTALMAPLVVRDAAKSTPARELRRLGRDFLSMMLCPSALALYRLRVAETARLLQPDGATFPSGGGRVLGLLAGHMSRDSQECRGLDGMA